MVCLINYLPQYLLDVITYPCSVCFWHTSPHRNVQEAIRMSSSNRPQHQHNHDNKNFFFSHKETKSFSHHRIWQILYTETILEEILFSLNHYAEVMSKLSHSPCVDVLTLIYVYWNETDLDQNIPIPIKFLSIPIANPVAENTDDSEPRMGIFHGGNMGENAIWDRHWQNLYTKKKQFMLW